MELSTSCVVTGGAGGVGRAIAEHLARSSAVVVLDVAEPAWEHPHVRWVAGDAARAEVAERAAEMAESLAPLTGWVNNAAIFRDLSLIDADPSDVLAAITGNLALAVTGCSTAVRHLVSHGRGGAIVNVSSHQGQRPVRGALPYATAKAGVEGLTRAMAVDHGPDGIRTNAVALGSITTERFEAFRRDHPEVDAQMAELHPLGRVGTPAEVATTVEFLLSPASGFVSGAILPIDGGRSVRGPDPESR